MAISGNVDWKFLLNLFLTYRNYSVGAFKKWARMGFPQSEVENSLDPHHVGSTVTHASVLERTRCAPVIFLGDALDEPLKAGCTRGEYIPFASRNICFTSITLPIITPHPYTIYRAQVTHLLHFLLLLQITCKKPLYLLSHPLFKGES